MAGVMIEALGGLALDENGQPARYIKDMPRMPLVVSSLSPALRARAGGAAGFDHKLT
jgi:hypothetical protein